MDDFESSGGDKRDQLKKAKKKAEEENKWMVRNSLTITTPVFYFDYSAPSLDI